MCKNEIIKSVHWYEEQLTPFKDHVIACVNFYDKFFIGKEHLEPIIDEKQSSQLAASELMDSVISAVSALAVFSAARKRRKKIH